MTSDDVEEFAKVGVGAFASFERAVANASRSKMESVLEACGILPKGITDADYGRLVGKAIREELATAVRRSKLTQGTAAKVASQLKAVCLAVQNGWTPDDKMGFTPAYEASVAFLAKPEVKAHVYGETKVGAPAGTVSARKGTGRKGAATGETSKPASGTATPAHRDPLMAAALILTGGQETRAGQLVAIFQRPGFVAEFDKWAATVIPTEAPKAPQGDTAMSAALAKAKAKPAPKAAPQAA